MPVARTSTLNLNELIAETSRNQRPGELSINFGLDGAQRCGNLPQGLQYRYCVPPGTILASRSILSVDVQMFYAGSGVKTNCDHHWIYVDDSKLTPLPHAFL
jgi:hypothetical protein